MPVDGRPSHRLAAHAARATPRRVAGRGRRRAARHASRSPRVGAAGVARAAPGRARARRRSPRASGPTCSTPAPAPRCAARCGSCGARSATTTRSAAGRDRIALRCETDLAAFDAFVAAGRLEEAVALHRGPLLADLDDDWVLEARDEHAERLGAALARLAAAADRPADAVGWARRRLALDPLDEDAARDLMRRLADAGDRPGALGRLRPPLRPPAERARPGAVGGDPRAGRGRSARRGPPTPARTGCGRASRLRARGDLPSSGATPTSPPSRTSGTAVRARGRRGRGDRRRGRDREDAAGARAAWAAPARTGRAPPAAPPPTSAAGRRSAPWVELLAGLARELDPPPAEAGWPEELARLAPSLPLRLGRPRVAPPEVPPELARARLFEAAVELAEHATADRPLVLLFDDVHLADAPTLELIAYLARRIERLPLLLVLTRRMTPRRDAVDALAHAARGRGVAVRELALEPLGRRELEALVGEVAALAAPQRERVVAAADGNPLLALESARAAARGEHTPPASLRGLVRASIATLDEPARRAAELAAVAGRPLDRVELAALAPPEAVLAALDCGLFRSADGRFGFRHDLLREAALADLDDTRRALLHEALAGAPGVRAGRGRAPPAARRPRRPRGRAAGRRPPPTPRGRRRSSRRSPTSRRRSSCGRTTRRSTSSSPACSPSSAAATPRWRRSTPRCGCCAPTTPRRARARAPQRRAVVPQRAVRSDARAALRPGRPRRLRRRRARRPRAARRDAADPRRGPRSRSTAPAPPTHTLAELDALGARARRALAAPPLPRHRRGFNALAEGRLEEAETVLVASGEAGERAGRPDLAYGGWANAACIASAAGRHERALRAGAGAARRAPAGSRRIEFQMAGLRRLHARPARPPRRGARRERPPGRAGGAARLAGARAARRPRRRPARTARGRPRARRRAARPRARGRPAGAARRGAAAARRGARPARPRRRGRRRDPRRRARADARRAPPGRCSSPGWRSRRR